MNTDVDLLFELGTLRFIDRTWRQFLGQNMANVAEHTFRVIWTALLISRLEKVGDQEKILKMALVHDATESRTGDVQYISRQYTSRDEKLAAKDMFNSTALSEFQEIWEEYEKRECIEAKIVKDADNIDVELELQERKYMGDQLKKLWEKSRRESVRKNLFTKTAKKLWDQIEKTNPHDWHVNSNRNRHNSGDWKVNAKKSS